MTKKTYIDPILATLKGYDAEMDRKIQEAIENLIRTRECVGEQYLAEPEITKAVLLEGMAAEAQIYLDFAKDIERIASGIQKVVQYLQDLDARNGYEELKLTYPRTCGNAEATPKRRPGRPRKAI